MGNDFNMTSLDTVKITTGWLTVQIRVESRRKDILDRYNILGPYPNSAKRSVSIFLYLLYYC
jgi:hypothetical protein